MTDETTNPNRWTAEVESLAPAFPDLWRVKFCCDGAFVGWSTNWHDREAAESLAEQINRPAPTAPADDLPPGVERIFYLAPRTEMPDGWRATEVSGLPTHVTKWGTRVPIERIPAEPATEWVPWWEAFNDELPLVRWGGQLIKSVQRQGGGVYLSTWGLFPVIRVEDDAKVEVQR